MTEPASGGVSPFDTGGLWHGKMAANVDVGTDAQKRSLFSSTQVAVDAYQGPMEEWLISAFPAGIDGYTRGSDPEHPSKVDLVVVSGDTQSWSWEVHIHNMAPDLAFPRPFALHWTRGQFESYLQWLRGYTTISRQAMEEHTRFVLGISSVTPDPYEDATRGILSEI
ncbi:hypothetical protein [Rhodococcus erythropolis]|uniref:hypothetical protein n=1 Tax=Rhodococcus erythropolis TaxID=1833 RepID=UPI0024B71B6C|nr:hypothetical protein [Rhodococcus erythropolis]MDJ0015066.1 hypothetical protein [Rhodococcus erythropolis]